MANILRLASCFVRVQPMVARFVSTTTAKMACQSITKIPLMAGSIEQKLLKPPMSLLRTQVRFMSVDPETTKEVEDRILYLLKLYDKIDPEKLTLGSHFMKDLGLDSLDHVEIIVAVENEFCIEIHDKDAERLLTPQELVEWLCEQYDIDE